MSSNSWKNKPKISDLKSDYKSSESSHLRQIDRLDFYNRIYNEDKYTEQRKGLKKIKSTYRSYLFKKMMEWVIPNIESPVLSKKRLFDLTAKTSGAIQVASKNADILNHQWDKEIGKVALVNKAARNFAIEGTCVIKVGWKLETKKELEITERKIYTTDKAEINEILVRASKNQDLYNSLVNELSSSGQLPIGIEEVEVEVERIIENRPMLSVRDNRAIIVDPSAKGDWNNVKFVIDIQETDYATLSKNDSYFNLDYVKEYIKGKSGVGTNDYNLATYTDYDEDDMFEFSDLARKKITMYEYWGYWDINGDNNLVPIVASWIGDRLVRLEENPYPHKKIPYVIASFRPLKDEIWGEPYATLLEDDQKSLTATYRAMQDITNENAAGQEFIDDSIFKTPIQKDNYERGKTVYVNRGTDLSRAIMRKSVEPVPKVLFDMKNIYTEHSTLLTGVEDMDGGAGSRITQSISNSPMPIDAKTNREMEILRRFLTMIEQAGDLILSMNKAFLLDDAVYANASGSSEQIGDTDALNDEYNISVDVLTPSIADNKASKIMFFLHNNGASMSPQLAAQHYAKTAELWNLPDLARATIEEASKPPSEEQVLAQQLELERLKLENKKAQIELLAKIKEMEFKDAKIDEIKESIMAGSQEAKVIKDKSQAELALAQADKMDAQVKLFNQEFELIDTGVKREWEKEDNEFHHLANLEREEIRTKREQENIKLKDEKKNEDKTSKEKNLDYIKSGTMQNDTYDAADDIFRNILNKNSLDTSKYTKDLPSIQRMPSTKQPMKDPEIRSTIAPDEMIGEDNGTV